MTATGLFTLFLLIFCAGAAFKWFLVQLNVAHIRRFGHRVPDVFKEDIDSQTLSKMSGYTIESSRFESLETLVNDGIILVLLLSGLLPWLTSRILQFGWHPIASGLVFFAVLALGGTLIDIPFELYSTFRIEKKHGFSTITGQLWLADFFKNLVLSAILLALLLTPVLALIFYCERTWWLWAWIFFALFQLLILWLYPVVIAPLFNKYEPVQDEALGEKIVAMADRAGFKVKGIFQVDAGKRSRHSNAYFTGIGKSKRIVLYDTLIESHSHDEILAVLAHEVGHWKKKHILKQLIAIEVLAFGFFYAAGRLLDGETLYRVFGFDQKCFFAGLLLLTLMVRPLFFFLSPIGSAIARRYERQADAFAVGVMGTGRPLADALKRLAKDNLANLYPHPFYVLAHYSHPPLTVRIATLLAVTGECKKGER